jgi:hypothetical protein
MTNLDKNEENNDENADNAELALVSTMLDEMNELENLAQAFGEDEDDVIDIDGTVFHEENSTDENESEVETVSSDDVDDLSVLDDLDLSSASDDELKDLDLEISKTEAYSEVEASGGIDDAPVVASKKPKNPTVETSKKPAVERDLMKISPAMFIRNINDVPTDEARTMMLSKRPVQKKIAEKFDNLFLSMNAGRLPSVYVNICFKAIDAKKEVTQNDLSAAVKGTSKKSGDNYSNGTISSQVGQIMNLFSAVGIAERNGSTLKLNPTSAVAEKLRNLMVA